SRTSGLWARRSIGGRLQGQLPSHSVFVRQPGEPFAEWVLAEWHHDAPALRQFREQLVDLCLGVAGHEQRDRRREREAMLTGLSMQMNSAPSSENVARITEPSAPPWFLP